MIQKVSSPYISVNTSSFKRRHNYTSVEIGPQIIDERKIINGITGLAVLSLAGIGYLRHKSNVDLKNIRELNYINQSIANHAVYSSNKRGVNELYNCSKHVAEKKAEVLQYKLENGMLTGKSKQAMKYIRNNLQDLKQLAM